MKNYEELVQESKTAWNANPDLREEFGNYETYEAYQIAVEKGWVKNSGKSKGGK